MECQECPYYDEEVFGCTHPEAEGNHMPFMPDDECRYDYEEEDVEED
tara:strand:- start:1041 stop:1181 length:141 start_codon:yes stop_codon:yes gene_type:complete